MQYYYECLEVYEKLVPEVKKHCKILRKLDARFLVIRDSYLEAIQEFEEKKDQMTPDSLLQHKKVIECGNEELIRIASQKYKASNSLMVTVEYHFSRINGYVREFKCEVDSEAPGTSIEIEKKFFEANKKKVREIQDLRDEYPFLDDLFIIPEAEPEISEPVAEPFAEQHPIKDSRINGYKQNIANIYQDIVSSFRDEPPGIRSSNKRNSLKIKTERRGSINGGTPSPRPQSPRLPKTPRYANNNDSIMLTLPEPSLSSNSVSPMEVSPGPHGNISFNYSENNILSNSFSTMPSFSGSQESRHGRQRKFTQKAQQMFKENKLGPGRPSNHHYSASNLPGTPEQILSSSHQLPQFNNSSSINNQQQQQSFSSQQHINKPETPHPIASSSYSFPQDYSRLPQSTSQPQQQYAYSSLYVNSTQPQIGSGAPQMPLQQHHQNASSFSLSSQHHQQPQQYYRPQQNQVRLSMPNGNNIVRDATEEDEDDREWCFCAEASYGEMICCENQACPFKWFHYQCVGINRPPTGKWYCPECSKKINDQTN